MEERIISVYERIAHHHGQRHRAHRIAVAQRARHHQDLLPARRNVDAAIAQVTRHFAADPAAAAAGTTPPFIITYNASSVPILQLGLSGRGLSEQQLIDFGVNFIRTQLVTIPGGAIPYPYGGKQRQVMVDLNPAALQSKGLSPADVVNAVGEPEPDSSGGHGQDRRSSNTTST